MKHVHSFLLPKDEDIQAAHSSCEPDFAPIQELFRSLSSKENMTAHWRMDGRVHIMLIDPKIDRENMIATVHAYLDGPAADVVLRTYEYGTIEPVEMGVLA